MLLGALLLPGAAAAADRLIDFDLEDQFGRAYNRAKYSGRGLAILAGDRTGSRYCPAWSQALAADLAARGRPDRFTLVGLAHLDGVPFFLKSTIRKKFPRQRDRWTLLDWKGVFADAYGFQKDSCNIFVFDEGGTLLSHEAVREIEAARLLTLLDRMTSAEPAGEGEP